MIRFLIVLASASAISAVLYFSFYWLGFIRIANNIVYLSAIAIPLSVVWFSSWILIPSRTKRYNSVSKRWNRLDG